MANQSLKTTFDRAASIYASARPSYPAELFDDLVAGAELVPPANLLEIGPGPGTATVPFAERGFRITALELGPELADQARASLVPFPDVSIVTSGFEDWRPPAGGRFDLVYCANAWHWLDPEVRWAKAASVLRPGGHLAIFGAGHAFPEGFDLFFTEIQQVYEEIGEGVGDWSPAPPELSNGPLVAEAEASGHFRVADLRLYVWAVRYDAEGYLRLLSTFSNHIAMEPAKREHLFAEVRRLLAARPDGLLTRHWASQLALFEKLSTPRE